MNIELIAQIFEVCILPLVGVLTGFLIKWISTKSNQMIENSNSAAQKKYLAMLNETITNCVIATTQTYVSSLKNQGKFDAEAQKKAFNMTYEAVMSLLTEEAVKYLNETVGDLDLYITNKIEADVNLNK